MTAPVGNLAVRFTADGSETVRRAVQQMADAAKQAAAAAGKAAADTAARVAEAHTATQQQYARTIQAAERAAYAEEAARQRTARAVQASTAAVATQAANKYGMIALSAASSFSAITYSGKVSGEALKNIFQQTALVGATLFGGAGPIVAAASVGALAIINLFTRARAEQKQLAEESQQTIDRLVDAGDVQGLTAKLRTLFAGTASKEFRDGLGPRLEALGLSPFITEKQLTTERERQNMLAKIRTIGARERVRELDELILLRREYDRLSASILNTRNALQGPRTTAPISAAPLPGEIARRLRPLTAPGRSASRLGSGDLDDQPETRGVLGIQLPDPAAPVKKTIEQMLEEFRAQQSRLSLGIADTIANGIGAGIMAAVQSGSVNGAIAALGSSMLASLGNVFAEIAVKAIAQSRLMATFMAFLTTNPLAALAAATAMMVLARGMGGTRGGASVGGGFGGSRYAGAAAGASSESVTRLIFGTNSMGTAAGMTPRQANHFTIIGADDPAAQRAITDLLRKAESRGLTTGGR